MYENELANLGISRLNEMQQAVIAVPPGRDLILLAPTGSGKTLAFLLPLLHGLDAGSDHLQALIIVPSRELALQIEGVFRNMKTGFKVTCCYGGHSLKVERASLADVPALVIGTPGRLADHLSKGDIDLSRLRTIVLDEFDKSLEFGFSKEMSGLLAATGTQARKMLTSATMIDEIPEFTGVSGAETLSFLRPGEDAQLAVRLVRSPAADKFEALLVLLNKVSDEPVIIFCNHRDAVERTSDALRRYGWEHAIYHGGMEQDEREKNLLKFRNGTYMLLLCTDLASRGLDIDGVGSIIHYQLPLAGDAYIHRNGRTARMGAKGASYLLLGDETLPAYLSEYLEELDLDLSQKPIPREGRYVTLYFSGGKKDKLSKTDIVGFLVNKGKLNPGEIGRIDIQDFAAYAAIPRDRARNTLAALKGERIKGKKLKIDIST